MAINRLNPDYPDAGLVQLLPSSVTVGSGSATVTGNGTINYNGASSIILDDIFNSTYEHYLLKNFLTSASAAATISLYFRSGGVDTTTSYVRERIYQYSTGVNGDEATNGMIGEVSSSYPTYSNQSVEIMNPYTASKQPIYFSNASHVTNTGVPYQTRIMGYNGNTTQFTGLKVYMSTGTFTGTLSIYGYRN